MGYETEWRLAEVDDTVAPLGDLAVGEVGIFDAPEGSRLAHHHGSIVVGGFNEVVLHHSGGGVSWAERTQIDGRHGWRPLGPHEVVTIRAKAAGEGV